MGGCCEVKSPVLVECEFLVVDGETCERCTDTRQAARDAVEQARARGIQVDLVERELDAADVANSNRVLVNGMPAEQIVGGATGSSECPSCSDMLGESVCCREVEVGGVVSAAIPTGVIFDAILRAAGVSTAPAGSISVTIVIGEGCG